MKAQAGHGEKLSRKKEAAITALLTQPTLAEAAGACGISASTLWRWSQQPEFSAQYMKAKSALLEGAVNRLRTAALAFVDVLHAVALDATAPAGSRAAAAGRGLELLLRAVSIQELENRVLELERSIAKGDN